MVECVDSIISPQTTRQPIPPEVMEAPALLGYVAGNSWLTYGPYAAARPALAKKGWITSVTLTAVAKARCYDIEPRGGSNGNIGVFMRNADRTHGLPWLYTFASNGAAMLAAARSFGYEQGRDFYYLAAHANGRPHICGPDAFGPGQGCGYPKSDGTQYLFASSFDRSLLSDYMLPQPVSDPEHYGWFDMTVRDLGGGRHGAERAIVEEYDRERRRWTIYPHRLWRLRDDMGILSARLAEVMYDDPAGDEANRRQWRKDQLDGRAANRMYVR